MDLLESKTKDLPAYEARQVKKILAEATVPEIEAKFDKALDRVRTQVKESTSKMDSTLESEIAKIVAEEDDIEENDMLNDRPHNGHKPVSEGEEDGEFETSEEVKFNEDGDVELDESEVSDQATMKWYCS